MKRAAPFLAVLLLVGAARRGDADDALRREIAPTGRFVGSAAAYGPRQSDPDYARVLGEQFDMLTPENAMKFSSLHPRPGDAPGSFDFAQGDALTAFARAHGMKVRGHTLVWHNQIPAWVTAGAPSPQRLAAILQGHIAAVAGHYAGQLYAWDVVNEAINADGSPRATVWSAVPDYVAQSFRWARAADPSARLFYNDYGAESSPAKADAIYNLVRDLKSRGVPIDGVGFQMHLTAGKPYGDFAALLRRFADLGVEVQITEFDALSDGDPADQAALYAAALKACVAQPACTAFVVWGFTDKYSWKSAQTPDLFDASFRPKPAFDALQDVLRSRSRAFR